jgi:hypothetical protein
MLFARKSFAAVHQTSAPINQGQAALIDVGQMAKVKMDLTN